MSILYKLPLGTSILDQFVSELAGEEASLLILPNRYQMEKVKFSSVPCTGIDTLANRILNENGHLDFEQINRRTQELLIEDLINYMHETGNFTCLDQFSNKQKFLKAMTSLKEEKANAGLSEEEIENYFHLTYFDRLHDKQGFLKAMTSFMGQLSNTGLSEEEIQNHFETWADETNRSESQRKKDKEVFTLYKLYRTYLKEAKWYDLEEKYRIAVRLLKEETTKLPWKKIRVFGFYTLDNLQIELFRELAKRVDLSIAMYYGEGEVYSACRDTYNSLLEFCTEQVYEQKEVLGIGGTLSQNIFKNNSIDYSSSLSTKGIELLGFTTVDKEIRYVFTQVKNLLLDGKSPKDIVVVVRKLDNFTGLGAVAKEYGFPISLGKACSLSAHPIFRFIKLLYQAVLETHEGAEAYFDLLKNPFVALSFKQMGKEVNKLREEKYFTRGSEARVAVQDLLKGDEDILLKLNEYLDSLKNKQSIEFFSQSIIDFLKIFNIEKLLGNEFKEGRLSIEALKSTLEAYKELIACVDMVYNDYKLCGREQEKMYPMKWLEILSEAASVVNIFLSHGRTDGVSIMEAANMQGLSYKYVFLMGLSNKEFPVINNESWVYNDKERLGLHMDLPTTASGFAEDAYFFGASLASAKEKIFITYHAEDDGEKGPYVDELQRVFLTKTVTDKGEEFTSNLPILNPEDKTCASINEVFEKYGSGIDQESITEYVRNESFDSAMNNADMKNNPAYHGKLRDDEVLKATEKKVGNLFSASSLKEYKNCPYAYLMDKVWGLGDGKLKEEEGGATDNGTIIHNTLSEFLNKHLMAKLEPSLCETYLAELDAVFDNVWDKYIAEGNVCNSILWQAEKPRLRTLLHSWLKDEIKNQEAWDYRPMATELQFFGGKTNPRVNLELSNGKNIKLQGAIDRIDSNGHKLFITDYKLSKSSVPTQTSIAEGTDLQMNIYLLAAESLYGKNISGGGYYVMKGLTRKHNLLLEDVALIKSTKKSTKKNSSFESWEDFSGIATKVITGLVEKIYEGDFTPSGKKCDYCPYGDICRIKEASLEEEESNG